MSDRKVWNGCVAKSLNLRKGRSCSDDDPCASCIMERDIQENKEMYNAMARAGEDYEDE